MSTAMNIIKNRKNSIKVIGSLTSSLKMMSSVKRAMAMKSAKYQAEVLQNTQCALNYALENVCYSGFSINPEAPKLIIVIGPEKGLCGGLNQRIKRYLETSINSLKNPAEFAVFGKKMSKTYLLKKQWGQFSLLASFEECLDLAKKVFYALKHGQLSSCSVLDPAMKWENLYAEEFDQEKTFHANLANKIDKDILYSIEDMIIFVNSIKIYHALCMGQANEHKERLIAMEQASKNCNETMEQLKLASCRIRQQQITQELSEVISGML